MTIRLPAALVVAAAVLLAGSLTFTVYLTVVHEPRVLTRGDWAIAIYEGSSPLDQAARVGAAGPAGPVLTSADVSDAPAAYVADPFMIRDGDIWYMFFEVLNESSGHGDIGLATSADGVSWRYDRIVLDEAFHLSYPFVFEVDGTHYMVPESAAAGEVRLYEAVEFPHRWRMKQVLVSEGLVDSTLVQHDGHWFLFGCSRPHGHDVLDLFVAETLAGPWSAHPHSPIVSGDAAAARPAGRFVKWDDTIVRYAQDSGGTYGRAVNAFRITDLTPTSYAEEPYAGNPVISAHGRDWARHGMHHIDPHRVDGERWVSAVDGYRKFLSLRLAY